jgi:hypothetical protein
MEGALHYQAAVCYLEAAPPAEVYVGQHFHLEVVVC